MQGASSRLEPRDVSVRNQTLVMMVKHDGLSQTQLDGRVIEVAGAEAARLVAVGSASPVCEARADLSRGAHTFHPR